MCDRNMLESITQHGINLIRWTNATLGQVRNEKDWAGEEKSVEIENW